MDAVAALTTGIAAGLAIAMQFGAVSLLLVETAVAGGPRVGIAAGMGVATVDLLFAAAAAVAGGNPGGGVRLARAGDRVGAPPPPSRGAPPGAGAAAPGGGRPPAPRAGRGGR